MISNLLTKHKNDTDMKKLENNLRKQILII